MSYIYPKHKAILKVPIFGASLEKAQQDRGTTAIEIPVRVRRASLTLNDHNQADTLDISFEWRDGGIDPRFLKNAVIEYYMGDASAFSADDIPFDDDDTLRFVGIATKVRRIAREDEGMTVDMEFHDYTTLFLKSKPFPSAGIPLYSDTLASGWRRVCENTGWLDPQTHQIVSNVDQLKDALVFQGKIDQSRTFGDVVPDRYRKLGKFDHAIPATADAWAVWSNAVGSLGLITFIDKDSCVVTTSSAYFIDDPNDRSRPQPPLMIWGNNIKSFEETANSEFEGKGVCITSYDYKQDATLEAYWPPREDLTSPIVAKRVVAVKRKKGAPDPAIPTQRYDFIEYNGVTDKDALLAIAKRAYDERSRQELTGTLRTCELFVPSSATGRIEIDLLKLRSGDEMIVQVEQFEQEALTALGDKASQQAYLIDRGYSSSVAQLIIANMESFDTLTPTFHVRAIHMTLDTDEEGGTFEVDINFANRIKIDGDLPKDENVDNAA